MRKMMSLWILILGILWMAINPNPVLAAYSSHQNDQDVNNFLAIYAFARSTKLDDCSLCHQGGKISGKSYGSCDYCHQTYGLQQPHGDILLTLNSYGLAYDNAGRGQQAILDIGGADSDGDGYTNAVEINALVFPGDKLDYPGLASAPAIVMNQERVLQLPDYSEFLLFNASKDTDWYARYRGVKIRDLLGYAGIGREATQITVFAPDGFSKTFPINASDPQTSSGVQYDVMGPYPHGYYFGGLDFVNYSFVPGHLVNGNQIPDKLYMLLGYLRDGDPLTKGRLVRDPKNPGRLVLEGEGPYRLIPPQKIAGSPDRPSTLSPMGDGWDYDSNKDHNAGSSIRSVAAIRVEPLPQGTTDFKWTEGGWNLVDNARLVIYGAIHPRTYAVWGNIADSRGKPVRDVQISFGLISLGQVGEGISSSMGIFRKDLPEGEYIAIPSKQGYTFEPESIKFHLSDTGYRMEFRAYPVP